MDDTALIKIVMSPPTPTETPAEAIERKERTLGSLLGRLSAVESRGMWLRMSREREGDALSEAFAKLPSSTRERLMSLLLDERRHKMVAAR